MEGYEIYRLSDDEIRHFGVKGMKWGKRRTRSSYMRSVDAHEEKTRAVADAKARERSGKKAAYKDAVNAHQTKTNAVAEAKSTASKAKRKAYMDAVNAHETQTKDVSNAKTTEKIKKAQIKIDKYRNRLI